MAPQTTPRFPGTTVNETESVPSQEITMSEQVPFLPAAGSSSSSSPTRHGKSSRRTSPASTPRHSSEDDDLEIYSEKQLDKYRDLDSPSLENLQLPHTPALRRSRLRLVLLCLLALVGIVSIGAWNAPEHVRTKAVNVVHQVGEAASDQWKSAKEWSGWNAYSSSSTDSSVASENEPHPLYVLPDPPWTPEGGPEEKFLSYMPHSGYHNQRVELANALALAKMLNRTLLLPPVWIGWPVTTQPYQRLQGTWDAVMSMHAEAFTPHSHSHLGKRQNLGSSKKPPPTTNLTADECKSYAKECRGTYQDTFVAWRFLTNIQQAKQRVGVVDRFNMTDAYAREVAGVHSEDEVYLLEDLEKYYFHFHDTDNPSTNLTDHIVDKKPALAQELKDSKYSYTVSIPRLHQESASKKLLMVGSLFGTGRLWLEDEQNMDDYEFFQRTLAFKNPVLDEPANKIRDLMGGPDGYAGVHARVGDGYFRLYAVDSMNQTFTKLMELMGVDSALIPGLAQQGRAKANELTAAREAAEKLAEEEEAAAAAATTNTTTSATKSRRHGRFVRHRRSPESGASKHADDFHDLSEEGEDSDQPTILLKRQSVTTLKPVSSRDEMSLSKQLVCRGELHTDPALLVLNNPVYIATDSRSPLDEPALQYFWQALPCAFVLSDFDRPSPQNLGEPVHSLKRMQSSVNENDGVQLGRLFLPFMEAMVAAKGVVTAGTDGSTFSGFAEGVLHDAYREGVL